MDLRQQSDILAAEHLLLYLANMQVKLSLRAALQVLPGYHAYAC